MRREVLLSLALVVGLAVAGGASTARAADSKAGASVDLSGTWRFDPEQSDMPGRDGRGPGMRGGPPPGGMGGGMGGGRGGMGGGMGGGMRPPDGMRRPPREGGDSLRGRPPGPPQMLHIQQKDGMVSFTDSTGVVRREIDTTGDTAVMDTVSAGGAAAGVQRMHGQWKNQRLETRRRDWRGTKRTETYRIEDKGRTLVVESKVEIEGRGTRTMKQVYHRVGG